MNTTNRMVKTRQRYPTINPASAMPLPKSWGFFLHSERAAWPKIMPGIYPKGPTNNDRHERLKEITAIIEYFDVARGVDVDAKVFVGFLLDDSGIVIRISSSSANSQKVRVILTYTGFRLFVVCRKPGALHPVTNATIKSLTCFCLFGLWPKIQVTRYAGGR